MNTYTIEYCDVKDSGIPAKKIEIAESSLDTAIDKAKEIVIADPISKSYTFVRIANNTNSDRLFDNGNEVATIEIDDILAGAK